MHASHQQLKKLVLLERKTLAEILHHLKIINDEKIFVAMGYGSLLDYCVRELGYSESAAYRRIQALRLERKIPGAKEKIASGEMNLSQASMLNQLIDKKEKESRRPVDTIMKLELLALVSESSEKNVAAVSQDSTDKKNSNARISSRKLEEEVRERLGLPKKKRELRIEMGDESYQKWVEFKGKHMAKRMTDEMLLVWAITEADKPKVIVERRSTAAPTSNLENKLLRVRRPFLKNRRGANRNPRFITAKVRREVFARAGYRCQYPGCNSTYCLEIDHIRPVIRGGGNELNNLQLLCGHHNKSKHIS